MAEQTNSTKIQPLLKNIPALKSQWDKPKSKRSDRYIFNGAIMYFMGSGQRIISKSAHIAMADEVDSWVQEKGLDNVRDLEKRTRSYRDSLCLYISTPSQVNGNINKLYRESSRGKWHLRCKGCGRLTLDSSNLNNLQFQSVFNSELNRFTVKPESISLICPECGYRHSQTDKGACNLSGGYIHAAPSLIGEYQGYQVGALASLLPALSWGHIADSILRAGKTGDIQAQMYLDNSIRGLPYLPRIIPPESDKRLKEHIYKADQGLNPDQVQMVILSEDTQDKKSVITVGAMDIRDNLHILEAIEVQHLYLDQDKRAQVNALRKQQAIRQGVDYQPVITVQDILKREYYSTPITLAIFDRQGHRSDEIDAMAKRNKNAILYQGYTMPENYKFSGKINKLLLR